MAATAAEAKAALVDWHGQWRLIVVDLFLAAGSGLDVLQAAQGRASGRRAVVLSNYATPDVRMRCAQLGVDAVFDKSNEIDALVDYCVQHSATPMGMESGATLPAPDHSM